MLPTAVALAEPLAIEVPAGDAPVAIGLRLGDGVCALAPATRASGGIELGPVAAATARWARSQGALEVVAATTDPCVGGPPVHPLAVPAGGWAVGLTQAPERVVATFPADQVLPLGGDRTWWHVPPAVAGEVAFEYAGGLPPTLFRVTPDPAKVAPEGWTVTLGEGEVSSIAAEGSPIASVLVPPGIAAVRELGGKLAIVGLSAGIAYGQVREGTAAAQPVHVAVTPPMRPPDGVVVNVGASRKVHLPPDAPPAREVVAADPAVAEVALVDGATFSVRGLVSGRTAVLWIDGEGTVRALTVVVGGR